MALCPSGDPGQATGWGDKLEDPGQWSCWEMNFWASLVCIPYPARPENGVGSFQPHLWVPWTGRAWGGVPCAGPCPLAHRRHTFSVTLNGTCTSKTQLCGRPTPCETSSKGPHFPYLQILSASFAVPRMKWGDAWERTQAPKLSTSVTGEWLGSCLHLHRYLYHSAQRQQQNRKK